MTLGEFFEKLKTEITTDYIVKLKYKYGFEEEYTYSNEILTTDINLDYVWLDDWNEGQTDIEVLGYIAVDNVMPSADVVEVVRCKDCKKQNECGLYVDSEPEWFCADGERKETE